MAERDTSNIDWPRWLAWGAAGGVLAGAAFLAVTMWFATSMGDPAKGPLLMISTIVQREDAMMSGTANEAAGLAVHVGLSALFGVVFAALVSRVRTHGTLALAGALYGAALYVFNFKLIAPAAFPVFEMANQPFELVVHVVFGALLSLVLIGVSATRRGSSVAGTGHAAPVAARANNA